MHLSAVKKNLIQTSSRSSNIPIVKVDRMGTYDSNVGKMDVLFTLFDRTRGRNVTKYKYKFLLLHVWISDVNKIQIQVSLPARMDIRCQQNTDASAPQ